MTDVSDDRLIDYVLQRLPPADCRIIEQQLQADEEMAAKVELLHYLNGSAPPTVEPRRAGRPRKLSRFVGSLSRRSWLLAMVVVLGVTALGWAAWYVLHEPPLLYDNFDDGWIDPLLWKTGRRAIKEEHGYLRLINRGSIVTQKEFNEPISLTLKWRWIDLEGDSGYRDTLTVALRTSGEHVAKHPFEIADGVTVSFKAHSGQISLFSRSFPKGHFRTDEGKLPMPADAWHEIRITDDGKTIAVYVAGPAFGRKYWDTPALKVDCPGNYEKHHIAIYNREVVSEVPHESHIDDFVVTKLKAGDNQ